MKKLTKILAAMLSCVLVISAVGTFAPAKEAEAASAPKLNTTSLVTPLGKASSYANWYYYSKSGNTVSKQVKPITVKNKIKGATYTFTSSDTKVAKISKKGGYVEGLKPGTATITCKQKLKGKTKTIGKCKVTVKAPKFFESQNLDVSLGNNLYLNFISDFQYEPFGSQYDYLSAKCADKGLSISEGLIYSSATEGTYDVDIYYNYKKQAIKVGSIKVSTHETSVVENYTIEEAYLGYTFYGDYLINWNLPKYLSNFPYLQAFQPIH